MTMSTDALLIGGPANARMVCLKLPMKISYIDAPVGFQGVVTYAIRQWYDGIGATGKQRWYWIATNSEYPQNDADIAAQIIASDFQPAWDLAKLPGAISEP